MSTHNIPFSITLSYPKSAAMVFFPKGPKEFETAVVNEPSVFEALKVYYSSSCTLYRQVKMYPFSYTSLITAVSLCWNRCV